MHNDIININLEKEKEKENSSIDNDNSYTLVENELYYSSPRRGIQSKSNKPNLKNKNYKITPFTATTENRATYFTFNKAILFSIKKRELFLVPFIIYTKLFDVEEYIFSVVLCSRSKFFFNSH